MKNFKFLVLAIALMLFSCNGVFAEGIGYIDYQRVVETAPFAKNTLKSLDAKALELQQYLVDKEKEYKSIDTPIQKKNFQDKVAADFKDKESAYMNQKAKSETEIFNKIKTVATQIMVENKLSAIISDRAVFVGGMDITDIVIERLKDAK